MNAPHVIQSQAVYDREAARIALGLTKTTLARELRLGRLRCSKRAGRYYILGEWLLQWLASGEVNRRRALEKSQIEGGTPSNESEYQQSRA
jgi:hypothetical protein